VERGSWISLDGSDKGSVILQVWVYEISWYVPLFIFQDVS
jgi:hypothetical protein